MECAILPLLNANVIPNDRTWEPAENLDNASDMVAAFHNKYPHKPSPQSCLPTRGTRRRKGGIMS